MAKKRAKKTAKKSAKRTTGRSEECKVIRVKGQKRKLCWGQTNKRASFSVYGLVSNKAVRG